MNKEYITIRIDNETKANIEKIRHIESLNQNKNLSLSETLNCIIEDYYKYKDLEY